MRIFGKLFHRRTRSDSSVVVQAQTQARPRVDPLPPSLSLPAIPEDALCDAGFVFNNAHSSTRRDPGALFSCSPMPASYMTGDVSSHERALVLEEENARIKLQNEQIRNNNDTSADRLTTLHSDYYAERTTAIIETRKLNAAQKSHKAALDQFEQVQAVALRLSSSIVLQDPVFSRARAAILTGATSEQALAESIQLAAAIPGSPWSSLLPPLKGSRTTDQHLHAVCLAAKTRKQLEAVTVRRSFWKQTAALQHPISFTVTPSSSALSAIGFSATSHRMALSLQRRLAVESLVQRRRKEKESLRIRVLSRHARPGAPEPAGPASAALVPSSSTHSQLPPLASQVFKEELIASRSSQRFSIQARYSKVEHSTALSAAPTLSYSKIEMKEPLTGNRVLSEKAHGKMKATTVDAQQENTVCGSAAPKYSSNLHFQILHPEANLTTTSSRPVGHDFETIRREEVRNVPPEATDGTSTVGVPYFHLPTRKLASMRQRLSRRFSLSAKRHSGAFPAASSTGSTAHSRGRSLPTVPSAQTQSFEGLSNAAEAVPIRRSGSFTSAQKALLSFEKFVGSTLGGGGGGRNSFWRKSVDLGSDAASPVENTEIKTFASEVRNVRRTSSSTPASRRNSQLGTLFEEGGVPTGSALSGQEEVLDISFGPTKVKRSSKRSSFRSSMTLAASPAMTDEGTVVEPESPYVAAIISDMHPTPDSPTTPKATRSILKARSAVSASSPPDAGSPTPKPLHRQQMRQRKNTFSKPTLSSTLKASTASPPRPIRAPLKPRNMPSTPPSASAAAATSPSTPRPLGAKKTQSSHLPSSRKSRLVPKEPPPLPPSMHAFGTAPLKIKKRKSAAES